MKSITFGMTVAAGLALGTSLLGAAAVVLLASAGAVGSTAYLYERFVNRTVQAANAAVVDDRGAAARDRRRLPATLLTGQERLLPWP